jgi:uroporphyrinogen decarboxylase
MAFLVPEHEKLVEYFNDPDYYDKFECDMTITAVTRVSWGVRDEDGYHTDEFGLRWNRKVDPDIGIPEPVLNRDNFDDYPWPDPQAPGRYDQLDATLKKYPDKFQIMSLTFSLFERSWGMVGQGDFLMGMIDDRSFIEAVLDRVLEFNLALIDEGMKQCPDIDGIYFGDDFGCQRGVLMGADRWREILKPRLAKQYARAHDYGKPVFIHSCGKVEELFDDFIDSGVNCFNPFQPEVMDIYQTKKKYRNRLAFYGGISLQSLLPFGTPDQVRSEVAKIIKEIGREGGYIAAPSHVVTGDVPAENIDVMVETLKNQ